MSTDQSTLELQSKIAGLRSYLEQQVVGQTELIHRMVVAILGDGHLLVEGAPGLAKTRAIKAMSDGIDADFHRIQFTPDLLPADLTGTDIYRPQEGTFQFQKGPLFHNLVLADEINRAPAKVQSALLEAMAERQITVGKTTYPLPDLFLVMATQNPIEQEGTYSLPEAQLDRFLMHIKVGYPSVESEHKILQLVRNEQTATHKTSTATVTKVSQEDIFSARQSVLQVFMGENLEQYLVQLVLATRNPDSYSKDLARWIQYGASPRATLSLDRCARAVAWLDNRDYVVPEDIQVIAHDIMRHRVLTTYEAEAEGVTPDKVISELLNRVAVP
ncbi:MoxR-like ATPase in aerotolerance operon [hydrothermal vent metagenome]|uniref:MoxR-like ATPase in aerotolerance operon n=1 Tax=hydrothermal vent metagenome TaxID=652676 RepID=A0A3B0YJ50_9ZZZZ